VGISGVDRGQWGGGQMRAKVVTVTLHISKNLIWTGAFSNHYKAKVKLFI